MARTVYEVQRDFAMSSGIRSEIIWDSLAHDQADVLKQKLSNLLHDQMGLTPKALATQRQQLFENVWKQRIYTNRTLLSAIIYVLVTPESDPALALQSTDFSCHPVIRTRKCVRADGSNSDGCCMIFIDETGRVYANWEKYIRNNALPKGTMIAPERGIYTFNSDDDYETVKLMVQSTPAAWVKQKVLDVSDKLVSIGGILGTVPIAASLACPVAAPILMAATVVGCSAAAYTTVRSATRLIDRSWHSQSTSLANSEARSSWLGVAGGVAGLGATGATTAVNVIRNNTGTAARLAVTGINLSSMVISGTGVVNSVYDLYLKISDEQQLTSFDVMQIASSFLIFTHSINNMRIASKATNGYRLRHALSTQSRKVFDRIVRESTKLHSNQTDGKFDIVRIMNDIPYKEALLSLHKVHSHLSSGSAVSSVKSAVGDLPQFVRHKVGGQLRVNIDQLASQLGVKFVQQIGNLASFNDVLDGLLRYYSNQAAQLLMQLTRNFIEQQADSIDRNLNTFVSTELVLYRILNHCVQNYESCAVDFLERRRFEIIDVISKYFQSLLPQPEHNSRRRKCATCHGVYYMCSL
ncbi:PREDICTED: uncharacterized protein LOC108619691 [Drosophila arizonae]|uniref:Uncharacterized protein LOC108619691 n=1 Tax=Drosophila arizonae TaxID=7263 RepID=A0ABM1PXH3_DROAR|nr:PREDICTED: uncharacterized protein LOC108619691 [Drosophila arizonae]